MKTFKIPDLLGIGQDISLKAPLAGWLTDLADLPDPVYGGQVLGTGLAIDPVEDTLRAPCDGVVGPAFRAPHGLSMALANGAELLLLIGVETYNLDGGHFQCHVSAGRPVRTGERLITFEMGALARKAKSLAVSLIVQGAAFWLSPVAAGRPIARGEPLGILRPNALRAGAVTGGRQSAVEGRF